MNLLTSLPYSSKLSYRYVRQFTRKRARRRSETGGKINKDSKKTADKGNLTHFGKLRGLLSFRETPSSEAGEGGRGPCGCAPSPGCSPRPWAAIGQSPPRSAGRNQIVSDGQGTPAPSRPREALPGHTAHCARNPPAPGWPASLPPSESSRPPAAPPPGGAAGRLSSSGGPTSRPSVRPPASHCYETSSPPETTTLRKCQRCPTAPPGPTSGGGGEELPRPTALLLLLRRPVVLRSSLQRPPGLFPWKRFPVRG